MTTYALNGLGRIGKLALRPLLERGAKIAFLNDAIGDPAMHAHLLEFDSVHGRWPATFAADDDALTIDGTRIPLTNTRKIEDLPLDGVDVVIDCTGAFKTEAKLAPYYAAGVKKVVVSAPVKDGRTTNIVYGVNDDVYDPALHDIVTAASCTTNCLAPVVKVLLEGIGIKHGSITTIHDVTNTQTIVDRPAKDLRRARSALTNLIPTTTGSATAITLIYPDLAVEEVNALFKAAADGPLKGILGYETRPLVSSDYTNDPRSGIVDALSTMVVNGTQLKLYVWYDNEFGYAHRLVDVALMVGGRL